MHAILLPANRLVRLRNSYRFPFQASVLARIPVIGGRVPLRGFWRRAPLRAAEPAERSMDRILAGATRTGARCSSAALRTADATRRAAASATHADRRVVPVLVAGATAGAVAMFYFDPRQGRRRRALVRDRLAHIRNVLTRDVPHRVERRGRFLRGVAKGVTHDAAEIARVNGHRETFTDDETLVARVRSEVLRDRHVHAGEIHVDAYEGCVTLRGQMSEHDIHDLVEATKRVEGVREVRSYLHTPGTLPPNKAESLAHALPAHLRSV
ncbi:MAG: BON domain-containing protein [Chloroflexi bacterium]|nr:BON domain-containing protein [Chloroflexota bacterium]